MELDIEQFRLRFPQFNDTTKFPDQVINAFWDMAGVFISSEDSPCRILNGKSLALSMQLLTAHLLFISYPDDDQQAGGSSSSPVPEAGGAVTSATINEISVSKVAPPVSDGWQWWLSSSPYGAQLWSLLSVLAVGGLSVGGLPEREGFRKIGGVFF